MFGYPDPPLSGRAISLRRWELHDLPLVLEASGDADLVSGTTLPDPFSVHDGQAFIKRQWSRAESGEGLSLVIEDCASKAAIGCVTLMLRRSGVADLGYWLLESARGRGKGREAVALVVPWALETLGVEMVEAFVHPHNRASRRLLAECGFSPAGSRLHAVGRIDEELLVYRRSN